MADEKISQDKPESEKKVSACTRMQRRRKAAGLCVVCGKPRQKLASYCNECREKDRPRLRRKAKRRREKVLADPVLHAKHLANRKAFVAIHSPKCRQLLLEAYGAKCMICGEMEPEFLTIDHIHNDGNKERAAKRSLYDPVSVFYHLRKLGFPRDRYQLLCFNCNHVKAHATFRNEDLSKAIGSKWAIRDRQRRRDLRASLLAEYGGRCACCREDNPDALTLDHVFNDGHSERAKNPSLRAITVLYVFLKRQGFPKDRYQLLCFNCNRGKIKTGICPHKRVVATSHWELVP